MILKKKRERKASMYFFNRMHCNAGGYPCSLEMVSAQSKVSFVEFCLLSILLYDPTNQDMRRQWYLACSLPSPFLLFLPILLNRFATSPLPMKVAPKFGWNYALYSSTISWESWSIWVRDGLGSRRDTPIVVLNPVEISSLEF